jgi:transposase
VAVGRSILIIIWHSLGDDQARFQDLGSAYYQAHSNPEHRKRTHVRELEALGYHVILEPAA